MPDQATPQATPAAPPPTQEQRRQRLVEEYELPDDNPPPLTVTPAKPASPSLPKAPAASETPPAPKHSRRVEQMARDLGISQAEIDASTPDELDAAVYHANRALHLERERQYREASQHQAVAGRQPPTPPAEEDLPWGDIQDPDTGARRQAKDSDIAEPLVRVLRQQDRAIKELQRQLAHLQQRDQSRENETRSERIDRFFAGQDKSLFGEGPLADLPEDSPERERRLAVWGRSARAARGDEAAAIRGLGASLKVLYPGAAPSAAASSAAAPPAPEKPRDANGRYTKEQERWLDGPVARPTHRGNAEEPLGKQRATNKLASLMDEAGQGGGETALEAELHSELPD